MKSGILCVLVTVASICLVTTAWSAQESPATIRDLIVLGIEKNIGLQISKTDVPLANEDIKFEDAAFDSEIYSMLEYSESSTPFVSAFSFSETDDSRVLTGQLGVRKRFSLGTTANLALSTERATGNDFFNDLSPSYRSLLLLDLTQPLLRNAGSQVNLTSSALARNSSRQAQLDFLLQAQTLALGITDLAYQLSAAHQIVDLRQDAVRLADMTFNANQKRLEIGVIPVSEVQEAETALADRELRLSLARQNHELLFEELNRQIGQRLPETYDDYAVARVESISPRVLPDLDSLYEEAVEKRPDLRISFIDQQSASLQTEFFQNQLRPKLDLKLQAGLNGLSGEPRPSATTNRFQGSWFDSTGSMLEADGYQWGVGLQFSIPLGNRQAEARLQQARIKEQRSDFRRRDLESALRTELLQQLVRLKRSYEQLTIARKFESLAELSLHQEQRRLEEGLSDTFRILSFQDKMIDAKIGRIEAAAQYLRNLAQLNYLRGSILEAYEIAVKIDDKGNNHEKI